MTKPSIKKMLEGIQTEIGAGMVLVPVSDADQAHNAACKRATRIIDSYIRGNGLFQNEVKP